MKTEGSEHSKTFYVEVSLDDTALGKGHGKTIKEAEQMAAKKGVVNVKKMRRKQ